MEVVPATPPRLFVEAAGLELLVESLTAHPTAPLLGEVAGGCLHMLSGVNNIVRRMILRMEALAPLLSAAAGVGGDGLLGRRARRRARALR